MMRIKHVLHPIRAARIAKTRLPAQYRMRRFATHSERYYKGDSRYNLQNVRDGFASRLEESGDDRDLLVRISNAYAKAVATQQRVSAAYEATRWWNKLRRSCLAPVMEALREGDIGRLQMIYRNFFRDPCATGLVSVPFGMRNAYFRDPIDDVYLHAYIGDALCRIDHWLSEMSGRFAISELAGPPIGNPFGVRIEGTLVSSGAEYHHYCAEKISSLLPLRHKRDPCVAAEIGGGYGGMAYYLIRNQEYLRYIDFDVPESVALASYYLLKAFPALRLLLYGEQELTAETLAASDVVLMPLFEMEKIPPNSVDVTFSSHAMSDLADGVMDEYLRVITGMTRSRFLYLGHCRAADLISQGRPVELRVSRWNGHIAPNAKEVECLYEIDSEQPMCA